MSRSCDVEEASLRREPLARAVGNLAGVVEWANEAFARLTGIPLAETVNKPVIRFLERAGIELEVVDFVAQNFFEGRTCRLEFPYERPDGRRLEILLEVDALRDAAGEIDRFVAVAREQVDATAIAGDRVEPSAIVDRSPVARAEPRPKRASARPAPASHDAFARPAPAQRASGLDLSREVERFVVEVAARARATTNDSLLPTFDLELDPVLDPIAGTRLDLEALVAALLDAALRALSDAGDAWGALSVSTGRTQAHRRFVSKVHAIAAGPAAWGGERRTFLEVHDTGRPIAVEALDRIRRLEPGDDPRERFLARALAAAADLGATLVLDGTPGCGNQALVVFPAASPPQDAADLARPDFR